MLANAWRWLARPAYALLWIVSLGSILRSAFFAWRHFSSPAWFDFWLWVQDYQRWVEGRYTFHDLVKPHYDDAHRIATTRVILLLDSIFFDMNGRLPVIASFALLLGVGWMVARLAALDGSRALIPPLVWMAIATSVCQGDNLIYPFQVQFPITCALACACAWLLTEAARAERRRAIALGASAGAAAILADFSMASGILLAPAMLLLLAMRRARWEAWAAFAPLCALGVALYEHHVRAQHGLPLLGWGLTWSRVRYTGTFLASALNCFSVAWVWVVGLAWLAALLGLGLVLVRRYSLRRTAMPSGDAALLALGLWVAACGPAGSLTMRLLFGPAAALVSRYATMSLLFAGVVLALAMRMAARRMPRPAATAALGLAAAGALVVFNLPAYDERAASLQRVIAADAELLVNNIALEGPAPLIFAGSIENVRAPAVFLHAARLNMFAPENGPPAALAAQARSARAEALPACRGWLDYGYALDDTGFLLRGWATDASGKHNAAWIAAIARKEGLIGMARPLAYLVPSVPGAAAQAREFESGFRFAGPASAVDDGRAVQVVALFAGRPDLACRLPVTAQIGPLRIVPASVVPQHGVLTPAAVSLSPGFAPAPGGGGTWRYDGSGRGTLRLAFPPGTGLGHDVAVPFAAIDEAPGRRMAVRLGDGTLVWIDLPSLWRKAAGRAVEIPADLIARHHGLAAVEVQAAGAGWLNVGMPVAGDVREDWARLFQ